MARVLVVDDSEDIQDALQALLTDEGFEVAGALDGKRGLELTRELHPDVILLDMMMPEMDGLEFLSRLPAEQSCPPVVASSGFDRLRADALRRGAVAFLVKPISAHVLVAALRGAIEGRPVRPVVMTENAAEVERARREALDATARAVEKLDRAPQPDLRDGLERVVGWLASYLGFGSAKVNLLRGADICIEAVGGETPGFRTGMRLPRERTYCGEVVTAGSTLMLSDAPHYPSEHFSRHPVLERGTQSYAAVPLTTVGGAVLGTLCISDTRPHEFQGEDVHVLQALARGVVRGMDAGQWPLDERGVFTGEHRDLFVDVAAARAIRHGGAAVAMLVSPSARVPQATGLGVVRLDEGLALLWGGPSHAWSPPEVLERSALARVDLSGVTDLEDARSRLRSALSRAPALDTVAPRHPCSKTRDW